MPASERACARKRRGERSSHGGPGGAAPRVGGAARPPLAGDWIKGQLIGEALDHKNARKKSSFISMTYIGGRVTSYDPTPGHQL